MSRLLTGFSILIFIFLASSGAIAQQPASVKEVFGNRAAKIAQSPADTGIEFDEYRLEKAAQDLFSKLPIICANYRALKGFAIVIQAGATPGPGQSGEGKQGQGLCPWTPLRASP